MSDDDPPIDSGLEWRHVDTLWQLVTCLAGVVNVHSLMSLPIRSPQDKLTMLADAVYELDTILHAGGPLPSRWATYWQRKQA